MAEHRFSVIAAVNNRKVLETNLLLSPSLADSPSHDILLKEGFPSASVAYNHAIDEAVNDILVFVHQDVYLPGSWFDDMSRAIQALEGRGIRWGVLGCFGSRRGVSGGIGRVYTTGRHLHGKAIHQPEPVDTLDEIVLVIRKSSGLRFDDKLPHFHMYGVDLCLQARTRGMNTYAVPAFCVHNTNQLIHLPEEFYSCYAYIKKKWSKYLPIHTSCVIMSRFDRELRERRMREFVKARLGLVTTPLSRVADPRTVLTADDWHREADCDVGV